MIAISYRRQDSSPIAGRLYDRLQAEFGKGSVFMDFDSIPYGVDFREHIKQTLQSAKVVVAIIGPEWCGGKESLNRRIDDPTDFVRLEVATALENGIPVIPVLVNNTPMPEANSLPPDLQGLAFRNGLALDAGIDFHHHADRLIGGIHRVMDPPRELAPAPLPQAPPGPSKSAVLRQKSTLLAITILLLALVPGGVMTWYFFVRTPGQTATSPAAEQSAGPSLIPAPSPGDSEPFGEYTYRGKVGPYDATFQLRFDADGRVSGTYTMPVNKDLVLRLEGRNPEGKLFLDEYTRERLSAHLELTLSGSSSEVRWQGTMYNTPPDKRVFPVSIARPRK
ncbi:MAG: hypothetical protein DME97_13705 [Verrucomicrobia bacterium]|nr:MAG: hypothetical protein DME97_13705 [Verrucomicrobiota bacterium]